jgi:5-methylcytosine-specific restriction endonuclease McrA
MTKSCLHCQVEFKTFPSREKRGKGKYCSVKCHGLAKQGTRLSVETKNKLRLSHLGEKNHFYGKKHSSKTKAQISKVKREQHVVPSNAFPVGSTPWNKGIAFTAIAGDNHPTKRLEVALKISKAKKGKPNMKLRGELNPRWKGGITSKNHKIRTSIEYKNWRVSVFERDDFTCVECKKRGYLLQADHIKPFALYPDLRFDLNNGRTLCVDCHRKTETWGNVPIYKKSVASGSTV